MPPPPVFNDGVPPPIPTPVEGVPTGDPSGASGPAGPSRVPDWVATPQAGAGGNIPSVVLPAVDAPPKGVMDLLKDAFALYKQHLKVFLITAAILFVPGAIISSGLQWAIRAPLMVGAASAEASAENLKQIQDRMGPDFADRLARGQVTARGDAPTGKRDASAAGRRPAWCWGAWRWRCWACWAGRCWPSSCTG